MKGRVRVLGIPGAMLIKAAGSADERGAFFECLTAGLLKSAGGELEVAQVNCSVSVRGALRGIAFTSATAGHSQAGGAPRVLEGSSDPRREGRHMEPVTEQRQVPAVVVYGYLRTKAASAARRAALARALAGYCELHKLLLAAIFTDEGGDAVRAPGFARLLGAISAGASYGLVLPTRAHLGSGRAAVERLAAITVTGRRLMIIR